jgi:hypothetical protein
VQILHDRMPRKRIKARRAWRFIQGVSRELTVQSPYNTTGGSIVSSGAFPFALTRLFFQALNHPIKIHVSSGLCAEGDAARTNEHKQHATRDLLRRLQQQGRLMGHPAGSAASPAGWPQFGNLAGIAGWPQGLAVSKRKEKEELRAEDALCVSSYPTDS